MPTSMSLPFEHSVFWLHVGVSFLCGVGLLVVGCGAPEPSRPPRDVPTRPVPTIIHIQFDELTLTPPFSLPSPEPARTTLVSPTIEPQANTPPLLIPEERRIEIINLPGYAIRGEMVTLTIKTPASVRCTAEFEGPSGSYSRASGLGTTQSDPKGVNMWNWRVPRDVQTGEGRVIVTCGHLTTFRSIRIS
jgi:hypothetical protein